MKYPRRWLVYKDDDGLLTSIDLVAVCNGDTPELGWMDWVGAVSEDAPDEEPPCHRIVAAFDLYPTRRAAIEAWLAEARARTDKLAAAMLRWEGELDPAPAEVSETSAEVLHDWRVEQANRAIREGMARGVPPPRPEEPAVSEPPPWDDSVMQGQIDLNPRYRGEGGGYLPGVLPGPGQKVVWHKGCTSKDAAYAYLEALAKAAGKKLVVTSNC